MTRHIILALFAVVAPAFAKVEPYIIDVDHSKVGFEVAHLVVSTVEGNFKKFQGTITFDPQDLKKTSLEGEVEVASVDTGVKKRDDHLKAADFFEAKKFPKMTFKTKKTEVDGQKLKLTGDLTMRGVTKEVVLDGAYKGSATAYDKTRAAFKLTTALNRQEFGMKFSGVADKGPVVGDEVTITLIFEAIPKSQM